MNNLLLGLENTVIDENQEDEELKEIELEEKIQNMKEEIIKASTVMDYDKILKKYGIKIKKNGKKASPLFNKTSKMEKIKILKMALEEPEDMFDYDYYKVNQKK